MDAYPPTPPKQVTVSCVPLTSYGFLQTLALANNALAIRIIFPLVEVIRLLSAYRVCQLRWANKKRPARTDYQRGICFIDGSGQLVVESTGAKGSGVFSSFSDSNCYIILESERGSVAASESVNIQLFDRLLN
ncbi:hypothetical protein [Paraglaciecola sp. MB-3u-78]|uniref:hypothetical protein n=1 Tax=Paraglaciecola sp. MB-3u-78 TaxID=2058332 RepID=UPI001E639BA3|nr:hypothetical protein [Paraglaciecola sp. MB-3u-78]